MRQGIQVRHTWTEYVYGSVMVQAQMLISRGIQQTWSRCWQLKHAHYTINQGILGGEKYLLLRKLGTFALQLDKQKNALVGV